MALIRFEATKLINKGKKGILKPDSDGYYTTVIGGLNAINSSGHLYSDQARYLFTGTDNKSILQRRIKSGNLKGENGHPKLAPGMSMDEFKYRLLNVEEKNVSHHIRSVTLDDDFGKNNPEYNNPELIGIIAEIKPTGPYGPALQAAFDNPHENVCFSIRGFTDDTFSGGRRVRTLFEVVTFDWVTEPGISSATKWDSSACESASLETVDMTHFTQKDIENMLSGRSGLALESDAHSIAMNVLKHMDSSKPRDIKVSDLNIGRW